MQTVADLVDEAWKTSSRRCRKRFFKDLRAITIRLALDPVMSMRANGATYRVIGDEIGGAAHPRPGLIVEDSGHRDVTADPPGGENFGKSTDGSLAAGRPASFSWMTL
jgi:hypothetical protein